MLVLADAEISRYVTHLVPHMKGRLRTKARLNANLYLTSGSNLHRRLAWVTASRADLVSCWRQPFIAEPALIPTKSLSASPRVSL
jgi:hypothetical protein